MHYTYTRTRQRFVRATVALASSAALAITGAAWVTGYPAHAEPSNGTPIQALPWGPDTNPCTEDSDCWDCALMGNHTCGPANSNGYEPGCYHETGALLAAWPCVVVTDPYGNYQVYTR